ncbi:MAG: DoxX family protein [Pseudomonadaceae bacterium]|nr:DoxX family protein [Pseudomonadaceae bacterium]
MNNIVASYNRLYDRIFGLISNHLGGVVSIVLRLILGPVLIGAGWEKITGDNWFSQDLLPFPFSVIPVELSWFLASWTEFIGGICLLLGLATRLWAIPLAVTMLVAAGSVHWDNGWPAIAPSNPAQLCVPDTDAYAQSNVLQRYIKCYNVNERTIEAADRLSRAKSILREHGNYGYLNGSGSIVKLNNGIEFAMMYFAMIMALLIIGGGRYFSLDYYLALLFKRQA